MDLGAYMVAERKEVAEYIEKNKELFLDHITDEFDCTYCDHYFKAVVNDEYAELIKEE